MQLCHTEYSLWFIWSLQKCVRSSLALFNIGASSLGHSLTSPSPGTPNMTFTLYATITGQWMAATTLPSAAPQPTRRGTGLTTMKFTNTAPSRPRPRTFSSTRQRTPACTSTTSCDGVNRGRHWRPWCSFRSFSLTSSLMVREIYPKTVHSRITT